jgi:myo-inositol 2-dehydrogenase/D-chiro-inositol 1-dehydrogenase
MTVRVGIVGAGAIAEPHVRAWQALGAEVLVYSLRPPTDFAARNGIGIRPSLESLIADTDVVDVCSPTSTHEQAVLAALAAGRHVVCEKPLARTAATAQTLADAADAAGLLLFPAHVVRYFPEYEDLWARLEAGEVGEVSTAVLTRRVAGPPPGSWFHDEEQSGGVALDLMIHELDQALRLFGPVDTVVAELLGADRRAARAALGHVGGVTSTVEAHWGPADTAFATSYLVRGSKGVLEHHSSHDPTASEPDDPYLRQLGDVLEHLRSGRPTRVTAAEGVAAVALAERVLAALTDG